MRDKSSNQIIRFDGKNVFFEVLKNSFNIGKVQINFIEYDPKNDNHQTKNIPLYIDMDKFLVLANDIINGRLSALANKERADNEARKKKAEAEGKDTKYMYAKEIYTDMGGITSESLQRKRESWEKKNPGKPLFNFEIPEGKCLSRQFKITPGASQPWIFSGEQGIGDDNNDTHLIVPVPSGGDKAYKPKEIVRVPLASDEELKKFALFVVSHINAYLESSYTVDAMSLKNAISLAYEKTVIAEVTKSELNIKIAEIFVNDLPDYCPEKHKYLKILAPLIKSINSQKDKKA